MLSQVVIVAPAFVIRLSEHVMSIGDLEPTQSSAKKNTIAACNQLQYGLLNAYV